MAVFIVYQFLFWERLYNEGKTAEQNRGSIGCGAGSVLKRVEVVKIWSSSTTVA